ncbi:MAG TPA: ABC transporter permease [Thermoanaerobaculia bacterium]|nr:ABC transporter permease [Thermoanaerobaculia bacterium]
MNFFRQLGTLIAFNFRTLPARKGSAAVAIVGVAGVVAVLVGVLSIGEGFKRVMIAAGSPDTAIVLRSGADSEMTSVLLRDDVELVRNAPAVARAGGEPLASPELFVLVDLPKRSTGTEANVPMRGVRKEAFAVRPEIKVTEGKMFAWGTNEVIVGRSAQTQFKNTEVGTLLKFGQTQWKVVGIFEGNGGIAESEVWADAAVLAPAYHRGSSFQTVIVKLASAGSFQQFKDSLTSDPRLNVKVERETDYYAAQSVQMQKLVKGLAYVVCTLMGLAAIFGALNTMYTAVAARSRDIATLEALGFGGGGVMISVMFEALFLALAGGILGALGAYFAFDGYRSATMNWQTFSQVAFAFQVTPSLMVGAILYALFIGVVGGFFPAIKAARIPVAVALRER